METLTLTVPGRLLGGTNLTIGGGRAGRGAMWPSNRMHDKQLFWDEILQEYKSFHHLFVSEPTEPTLRIRFDSPVF